MFEGLIGDFIKENIFKKINCVLQKRKIDKYEKELFEKFKSLTLTGHYNESDINEIQKMFSVTKLAEDTFKWAKEPSLYPFYIVKEKITQRVNQYYVKDNNKDNRINNRVVDILLEQYNYIVRDLNKVDGNEEKLINNIIPKFEDGFNGLKKYNDNQFDDIKKIISDLNNTKDDKTLNLLVKSQIDICKKYILSKDLEKAETIILTLFEYDKNNFNDKNKNYLHFLKFAIKLLENDRDYDINITMIDDIQLKYNVDILMEIKKSKSFDGVEYANLNNIAQMIVLEFMFTSGKYDCIKVLYNKYNDRTDFLCYYNGLAHFNSENYEKALVSLEESISINKLPKYDFFRLMCACLIDMNKRDTESLKKRLILVDDFESKHPEIIMKQKLLFSRVILQVYLVLDTFKFVDKFNSFQDEVKKDENIQLIVGRYYYENQKFDQAIPYFERCYCKNKDMETLKRLLFCKQIVGDFNYIIEKAIEINERPPEIFGVYLNALSHVNDEKYTYELVKAIEKYSQSVEYLKSIIIWCDFRRNDIENSIYVKSRDLIEEIVNYQDASKIIFAELFVYNNDIDRAVSIVKSIVYFRSQDVRYLLNMIGKLEEKYKCKEIVAYLISLGISSIQVYKLMVDICWEEENFPSALKYLKRIFEVEQSEEVASNIVQLISATQTNPQICDYQVYFDFLQKSKDAFALLFQASAYLKMNNAEKGQYMLYKSAFNMGDTHLKDANFLELCLQNYFLKNNSDITDKIKIEVVKLDTVVVVEKNTTKEKLKFCLNSDEIFCTGEVKFDVIQLEKDSVLFLKLLNKSIPEQISYKNDDCIIVEILDKHTYLFNYLLTIYRDLVPNSNFMKLIEFDSEKDLKQQIIELLGGGGEKQILDLYYRESNDLGIPIELISQGDYSRYISVVRYLLFEKNQRFIAGLNLTQVVLTGKFVITMSSLVVMQTFNMLNLLEEYKDNLIIAKSLKKLIANCYMESSNMDLKSPGNISIQEECVVFDNRDRSLSLAWNEIYEFINKCQILDIEEKERDEFKLEDILMEDLFHKAKIDISELDAIIIAKRENVPVIMDDLFFRNFASFFGVRNMNFSYLLKNNDEIIKVSKSNYLYMDKQKIIKLMLSGEVENLFNSEIKKKYYGTLLSNMLPDDMEIPIKSTS